MSTDWLTLLRSKRRLDREKALEQLKLLLSPAHLEKTKDTQASIESKVLELVLSLTTPWEERHGGLLAAGILIQATAASQSFCDTIKGEIPLYLEDSVSRVRIAAGKLLEWSI